MQMVCEIMRRGKIIKCLVCRKGFYVKPSYIKRAKYCSHECYIKSRVGRKHPKKWCENISRGLTGRKLSKTLKEKLSKSHKGEIAWNRGKTSKEDPRILSGEKHPKYKGGKTKKKDSALFRRNREIAFKRDGYSCQWCGTVNNLIAHHIDDYKETEDHSVDNLYTMCRSCHAKYHFNPHEFTVRDNDIDEVENMAKKCKAKLTDLCKLE